MDKEINAKVKTYFNKVATDGTKSAWKCLICENDKLISGNVTNCKDHLVHVHAEIAETLQIRKKRRNNASSLHNNDDNEPLIKRIKYNMDINEVKRFNFFL